MSAAAPAHRDPRECRLDLRRDSVVAIQRALVLAPVRSEGRACLTGLAAPRVVDLSGRILVQLGRPAIGAWEAYVPAEVAGPVAVTGLAQGATCCCDGRDMRSSCLQGHRGIGTQILQGTCALALAKAVTRLLLRDNPGRTVLLRTPSPDPAPDRVDGNAPRPSDSPRPPAAGQDHPQVPRPRGTGRTGPRTSPSRPDDETQASGPRGRRCHVCGRQLWDSASVALGMGSTCAGRFAYRQVRLRQLRALTPGHR